MQNLGDKQRVLWYFPKWPMAYRIQRARERLVALARPNPLAFDRAQTQAKSRRRSCIQARDCDTFDNYFFALGGGEMIVKPSLWLDADRRCIRKCRKMENQVISFFSFTFDVFTNPSVILANYMAQDCVKTRCASVRCLQILWNKFSVSLCNIQNHLGSCRTFRV